ncbi:MAG: DASH family cryptochrome [Bacteroidota bacterium]
MKPRRIVVWFRQDLRLHDNEALHYALERCDEIIPVYVFDERQVTGKSKYGFAKTGRYRAKFLIEAVEDLRNSFRKRGSDLIVRFGKPEEEVYKIAKATRASWVYCNRERTQEEVDVQNALEGNLWRIGIEVNYFRGKMLYYTQDLPFPVSHTPDTFTSFRKEVEKIVPVREPFAIPNEVKPVTFNIDSGKIITLSDFGYEAFESDSRAVLDFKGGETAALARVQKYLWEKDLLRQYKETRNGLIGGDYSSKLSPWLSLGCVSPKLVYFEVRKYEAERISNQSTYWLIFELLWRDYFRLMGKKHGNNIFKRGGIKQQINSELQDDMVSFRIWKEARTGVPFIDANLRELNLTGFMSNRGRQNVASFLVHDLKVNWQIGAEYFESLLLDYDPCSNWGNWNYIAGVGTDPREDRYFNIISQAKRYDPHGDYVKLWIPELIEVPAKKIHQPDLLSSEEQDIVHVRLGDDYPNPIFKTTRWT